MKLYSIETGYFKLDGGAMYGVVPKSIWNKLNPADENNMCNWAMRSLLIEDGDKLILIDTGIGNKQSEKFFSHYLLHGNDTLESSLKKYGFSKDDITDVIHTHLHFDHCGGAIERVNDKLVPAFKNATFWSNKYHWETATEPNAREKASFLKENILPMQECGQLKFVDADVPEGNGEWWGKNPFILESIKFSDNIDLLYVSGHTQRMMLPKIKYNSKTIVYVADLLPSVGHLPIPYVMAYDMFPLTTLQEKEVFLNEALREDYVLFFEHDPINECCTLQQTERGIRQRDCFKLSDL
ncbi:MAG: MBL fold metallo-hydrolase [Chitinophaga sp.]|jgi:glyoxylase-like metal-dependent hydrolase (beta-lactamase superfamily II)|nr:MBL fold metallo-hydrolase [Chitinophaga sp.]